MRAAATGADTVDAVERSIQHCVAVWLQLYAAAARDAEASSNNSEQQAVQRYLVHGNNAAAAELVALAAPQG